MRQESKKEIEGMDCKKGIEVICNPENRKKIDEGIEVIEEAKDGDDAKKFGVKDDLEELLKQLQVKTVSCKDVTFRIFGFSLTTFNIIVSLFLLILLTKIFKNYEKFKS